LKNRRRRRPQCDPAEQDEHPPARQHVAEVHQLLRDPRQFLPRPHDLLPDLRNHLGRENEDGEQTEADQDDGIDHRRQDLGLDALAASMNVAMVFRLPPTRGDLADRPWPRR
jgi:hypothetical protein